MISRITVQHYQSLVNADVELGRVTVILGPNDHGKSALIRAFRAIAEAQSGTAFITYGKTKATVTLYVDDHVVKWDKGENVNSYSLDGIPFEKIGRTVPDEVEELLGLGAVSFDKNLELSLNFADQDDPNFLIPIPGGLSPSSVAKILGDLTNLNVLFKAVQESSRRRKVAADLKTLRDRDLYDLSDRITEYKDLQDQKASIAASEALLSEAQLLRQRIHDLQQLAARRDSLRSVHLKLTDALQKIPSTNPIVLQEARALLSQLSSLQRIRERLSAIETRHDVLSSQIQEVTSQLVMLNEERERVAKETPRCPTCGQEIREENVS